jgi:putative endonuclease
MDKHKNYRKGKNGEFIAKEFLINDGYELIEMNYKNKIGEIDLIMEDNKTLVFAEVKLKIGDRYGFPEEMIDKRKINQIKRVAESFLVLKPQISKNYEKYRIDAICIVLNDLNKVERISHYQNLTS